MLAMSARLFAEGRAVAMGVEEDLAREAHTCSRVSCVVSTLGRSAARAAGRDAKDREDAVNAFLIA